jgi:chemotaxis protein CheC
VTRDEDRLREVTSIAAAHAANALAKLFDCVVLIDPPRCRQIGLADLPTCAFEPDAWVAGVFTDLSGKVSGELGIVLEQRVVWRVMELLFGDDAPTEFDARARSALAEVGNIAVSAAAGAIGDLEGGVVIPSVPRVGYDMAGALLVTALHPRLSRLPACLAETDLVDRNRVLRLRFLWIPA